MTDFALYATVCETALWPAGTFWSAYCGQPRRSGEGGDRRRPDRRRRVRRHRDAHGVDGNCLGSSGHPGLRPSLRTEFPKLVGLSDTDLLVEVFRQGLSRHGSDRGCGLKGSAAKAIKFEADLDVRLPNQRVLLTPARGIYQPNRADCYEGLPLLWGTHIAFAFGLGT
jgi:hypothetical protein